jgi:hypothetical protein
MKTPRLFLAFAAAGCAAALPGYRASELTPETSVGAASAARGFAELASLFNDVSKAAVGKPSAAKPLDF